MAAGTREHRHAHLRQPGPPVDAGRHHADRPPERRRHVDADARQPGLRLHRRPATTSPRSSRSSWPRSRAPATTPSRPRVGILGDSQLIVTQAAAPRSPSASRSSPRPARTSTARPSVSGTPTSTTGTNFTMAAEQILDDHGAGTWTLDLNGGTTVPSTGAAADTIAHDHAGASHGSSARTTRRSSPAPRSSSRPAGPSTATGTPLVPTTGDQYVRRAAEPEHPRRRVDAGRHASTSTTRTARRTTLGTLTENSHSPGFGMGGDTVVAGQSFPGGITYSEHRERSTSCSARATTR